MNSINRISNNLAVIHITSFKNTSSRRCINKITQALTLVGNKIYLYLLVRVIIQLWDFFIKQMDPNRYLNCRREWVSVNLLPVNTIHLDEERIVVKFSNFKTW